MSYSRKLRRSVKQSMISKVMTNENTTHLLDEYFDRNVLKQEMYNEAVGEMLLLFAGFQRIHEKRGKKKITEAVEAFVTFCNDMMTDKVKYEQIVDMLKEETGYDFNEHSKTIKINLTADTE